MGEEINARRVRDAIYFGRWVNIRQAKQDPSLGTFTLLYFTLLYFFIS